ncbi:MAG: hypothetical protein UR67_C0005G0010 [candidate division CPR3 bacterium GW2011_GWF2_35_18]|uniref:Uncharacterized protein n=1 Tax=candidate division CPR3 bacterium GW2011_GWF2_35_18 TaxID=1618350 RepID=A0A0G0C0B5_UNCC3|nr:MAG: hypothetical protein UR67_C0005G0010 [candidate division CPR3 bacterium GW2011_GWF2_35_18]
MTRIKMKSMTPFISLFSIIDQRMVVAIKVIDNQNKEIVDLKRFFIDGPLKELILIIF